MRPRVLNLEPERYSPAARRILDSFARVDEAPLSPSSLRRRIAEYDVLIVRLGYRIDRDLLEHAPRLRAVVTATTSPDHIDAKSARARRVEVLSLKGERELLDAVSATAEHAWALLLALVRRIPAASNSVLDGRWDRDRFIGSELQGRTMGIIGYGRLGRMVGRYARAFRMRVVAHDPAPSRGPGVEFAGLDELLRRSDAVSVHAPLEEGTRGLLGRRALSRMKPGAWLVNTSRGDLIDEPALLRALESGRLGGAALDVLSGETAAPAAWLGRHPLVRYARRRSNLLITPHLGGATRESMERTEIFMAEKLKARARRWR